MPHISCLPFVLLLPVLLSPDPFNESLASFAYLLYPNLVRTFVENLVDLKSLHELAHTREVSEGEEAAIFLVE